MNARRTSPGGVLAGAPEVRRVLHGVEYRLRNDDHVRAVLALDAWLDGPPQDPEPEELPGIDWAELRMALLLTLAALALGVAFLFALLAPASDLPDFIY